MHGYACTEPNKRIRKKPWVRYERSHSLSAVHVDWYYNPELDIWAGPVLDDTSRYVLDDAYHKLLHIGEISGNLLKTIGEVNTDA